MQSAKRLPGGGPTPPFTAEVDLRDNLNRFVKLGTAAGSVRPITSLTDVPVAVQQDRTAQGDPCNDLEVRGVVVLISGGAFDEGDGITHDATGRAVLCTPGKLQLGKALMAATGAGQDVSVYVDLVNPPTLQPIIVTSASVNPASIAATTKAGVDVAIADLVVGDGVIVAQPATLDAGLLYVGHSVAAGTLTLYLYNATAAPIDQAAATWRLTILKSA